MLRRAQEFIQKIDPQIPLRLGLGLVFLYSGSDMFVYPEKWISFIPLWFSRLVPFPIFVYLKIQGGLEFILGILFLLWFLDKRIVRIAAIIAIVELSSILLAVGLDAITFRDIGLLGAAVSLFILSFSGKRAQTDKRSYDES